MRIKATIVLAWLCFLASSNDSCRKYTCDGAQDLPGNVCMAYNETRDVYVLSPCDSTITTCPTPAEWGEEHQIECVEWTTRKVFSSDTFEDYYDSVLLLSEGAQCDQQAFLTICDYNSGLVCNCPNNNCTCIAGLLEGASCSEDTPPCVPGFVCNNNVCIKMYSLAAGETATDERACVGGGPLLTNYFSKSCPSPSTTMGGIPRVCSQDRDCLGTDNTYTKCVCGLNDERRAYCDLHFNDDPWEQYRYAYNNYIYKDSIYWVFVTRNYPFIQGVVPNCLRNVWRDFGEYKRDLTGSAHLLLPTLFFALG